MHIFSIAKFLSALVVVVMTMVMLITLVKAEKADEPPFPPAVQAEALKENKAEDSGEINEKEETAEEAPEIDPRKVVLDGIELTPQSPQSEDLNLYLQEIMAGLTRESMSAYEKLWISYDYIVDNTSYGSHVSRLSTTVGNTTCREISKNYGTVEGYGAVVLASKTGLCNAYSSAFVLMANEIGVDAYLVKGYTRSAWSSYVYHEWAEVNIDGTLYVFDPQLEQNLMRDGFQEGVMFCRPYSETDGRYSKK